MKFFFKRVLENQSTLGGNFCESCGQGATICYLQARHRKIEIYCQTVGIRVSLASERELVEPKMDRRAWHIIYMCRCMTWQYISLKVWFLLHRFPQQLDKVSSGPCSRIGVVGTRSNSEAMLCLDNATGKAGTGSSIAPADQTADFHLRSPAASPQRFAWWSMMPCHASFEVAYVSPCLTNSTNKR